MRVRSIADSEGSQLHGASFKVASRFIVKLLDAAWPIQRAYLERDRLSASEKYAALRDLSSFELALNIDKAALARLLQDSPPLPSTLNDILGKYTPAPQEEAAIDDLMRHSAGSLGVVQQYE